MVRKEVVSLARRLTRWAGRRLIPGGEPSRALPFVLRWGVARARALRCRRGLVRGTRIVWPGIGQAWAIGHDIVRPTKSQVLVEVVASAISPGTERAFFAHLPHAITRFPSSPGYSAAGVVAEVGTGVTRFRPNDRVALAALHASVAVVSDSEVYAVPATIPLEEAAFVQLGIIALHALHKAQPRPGEPLLVLGHGIIGQLLIHLASAHGIYPLISVSRTARRVTDSLVRTAQRVLILERDGYQALEGLSAPVTVEATGSPEGITAAIRCTGNGGRIVLAGSTRGVTEETDFGRLADRAITVVGAHISSLAHAARPVLAQTFLRLLEQKRIDVASLISQRVHPWEAEWFYRRLAGKDNVTIGAVFSWDRLSPTQRMHRVSLFTPPDLAPMQRSQIVRMPVAAWLERERYEAAWR